MSFEIIEYFRIGSLQTNECGRFFNLENLTRSFGCNGTRGKYSIRLEAQVVFVND